MKKVLISVGAVVVIGLYAIFASRQTPTAVVPSAPTTGTTTATQTTTTGSNPPTNTTAQYKDGTYTGPVSDAIYGKLQVVAVIQGGKITDVQFPVYPTDGGHTMQLSQQVMPILKQEAIQSQSASVNIVSGATQTSQAFQQSLAAALAMAK